ncbi:hypothetical protein N7493_000969 [Penicillium malachiteum]|uniref:Ankyrin n=1 Tax=Penicillium malachiteum TaxID=1324776 RepID=A0AAD6HXN7_9EURO|nr:hypothetical protein N7493_000969 [Penicillium malachiteum]
MEDPESQDIHELTVVRIDVNHGTVNRQTAFYGDALQAASCAGHENIVQMLLDKGANINATAGVFGTAIEAASGNARVRQMLLHAL